MAQKKDMGKILRQFGLVFVALIIIIFMSITSDVFLTSQNIINILRQISINGILAVGMTFVILKPERQFFTAFIGFPPCY